MAVDDQARKDIEQGNYDRNLDFLDRTIVDITGQHPDTKAYYDGREGKDLDEDKKDK